MRIQIKDPRRQQIITLMELGLFEHAILYGNKIWDDFDIEIDPILDNVVSYTEKETGHKRYYHYDYVSKQVWNIGGNYI